MTLMSFTPVRSVAGCGMMAAMEIITPRLLLREFVAEDLGAVHEYARDPEVSRFMDWGPNEPGQTAAYLEDAMTAARAWPRTRYPLAVVKAGVPIGSIQLDVVSPIHQRGEFGYVLARSHWGYGYATEAARALLRFAYDTLDLHKVCATCDPDNVGSVHVLTKLGMPQEGYLRDHSLIRGEWRDRVLFGLTSDEARDIAG